MHNELEIQKTAFNYSCYVRFDGFVKKYKQCTNNFYSFSANDTNIPSNNPLRFMYNLLERI